MKKKSRLFGAILLIAGTTIGAGMLALPVTTGLSGFIPSALLMVLIWLFMMLTAFYLLEVNLRLKGESNIISMTHKTLGRSGEAVAWVAYLLLLYALTAAYLLGCSQILADVVCSIVPICMPAWGWNIVIFLLFGGFLYFGTEPVDYLNRILMLVLILSYIALIGFGLQHVKGKLLTETNLSAIFPAIPVVLTSFGYHIIIPTLTTYLEHDAKALKKAILIGSLIPVLVYLLFQLVSLGLIPLSILEQAKVQGSPATLYLKDAVGHPLMLIAGRSLSFFAIVTSLLGVTLSLSDFLADGLKVKKKGWNKVFLILLTFTPPLLFAIFYPKGFILALKYAGYLVIILLALLPALMAYFERYVKEGKEDFLEPEIKVPGGKPLVIATVIAAILLLILEGVV